MKPKLLIANFKMNFNASQMDDWLHAFVEKLKLKGDSQERVVICPANIHIYKVQEFFRQRGLKIQVGAQQALSLDQGALTGETSISMLSDYANYLLIGHSEQRQFSNPTDQELQAEVKTALKFGITPIICVGEPKSVFEAGDSASFISAQLKLSLGDLDVDQLNSIYIAYEPIWAIGHGVTPTNQQIEDIFSLIQSELKSLIGEKAYVFDRMLYGGSVNINNLPKLNQIDNLAGYLVGGASLDAQQFAQMANYLAE